VARRPRRHDSRRRPRRPRTPRRPHPAAPTTLTHLTPGSIHAIVISSDTFESDIYERAIRNPALRGIPILRIYGSPTPERPSPADLRARLVARWGLTEADARWLAENRDERHDATLPMLPPERTELHLRRYEFAARFVAGRHVVDAACGTGYGASLLSIQGTAASVTGIDIDPRATDYATRRFGSPNTRFFNASATATGLPAHSFDVAVSFETVEHIQDATGLINEFARILKPGGTLVLSTPNNAGLTKHHVHTFTQHSLGELLSTRFTNIQWHGQWARIAPPASEPAAGIRPIERGDTPEYLIAVATPRK
jgi:2-polyprenyl-3-methyl-5-hydroxy-6-metoxy-1,4-benzoquinol methylase